jgi:hypothetical protein
MKRFSLRRLLAVVTYMAFFAAPLSAYASGAINLPVTGQSGSTGTAWPSPRAITSGSTITDNLTGLVWAQAGNLMATRDPSFDTEGTAGDGLVSWQKALDYVKKLNTESYLGFSDWRLPNMDELASLYDYSKSNPATALSFTGLSTTYWSSSSYAGDTTQAWTVNLQSPGISYSAKTGQLAVLPVRGGKTTSTASDASAPSILAFRLPATSDTRTVTIQELTTLDDKGVTGFWLSEDPTTPIASATGWGIGISYTFAGAGARTLYAWVKDAAGNVSPSVAATITINGNILPPIYVPSVKLPVTGELASSVSGDDASLQQGVSWPAPRFKAIGAWTVADQLTNLMWAQQGNLMFTRNGSFDADATAGDGLVTWQHALDYVKKLNTDNYLGYADWRLPNVNELASLFTYDASEVRPFSDLGTTYWSSTSYAGDASQAWTVNLQSPGISYAAKTGAYPVLPVRGGRAISAASPDTSAPSILAFRLPQTWASKTVPIQELTMIDDIGVTGYWMSEDATTPSANATGWQTSYNYSFAASYTFPSSGAHTLNVWVKDAAGNVSAKASASVTIADSANQIASYAATVKVPATGETVSSVAGDDASLKQGVSWPAARFTTVGNWMVSDSLTGLAWIRPGNLITVRDPSFDADATPGDSLVTWQHALDYLKKLNTENFLGFNDWRLPNVNELATLMVYDATNVRPFNDLGTTYWSSSNYAGDTTQAWTVNLQSPGIGYAVKSASQFGVLPVRGGTAVFQGSDTAVPQIIAFSLPATWGSLTAPILALSVNDNIGVTGYFLSESSGTPGAADAGWLSARPINFSFATAGAKTLYVWVKDAAGNVSTPLSATTTVSALPLIPLTQKVLLQTGQTVCYDSAGSVLSSCDATGQDAMERTGVPLPALRFTKSVGVMTDVLTGLSWVRDGNLVKTLNPAFDADGTAGDGALTWQHALDFIAWLNAQKYRGQSDWRLPNLSDLRTLADYSKGGGAARLPGRGRHHLGANGRVVLVLHNRPGPPQRLGLLHDQRFGQLRRQGAAVLHPRGARRRGERRAHLHGHRPGQLRRLPGAGHRLHRDRRGRRDPDRPKAPGTALRQLPPGHRQRPFHRPYLGPGGESGAQPLPGFRHGRYSRRRRRHLAARPGLRPPDEPEGLPGVQRLASAEPERTRLPSLLRDGQPERLARHQRLRICRAGPLLVFHQLRRGERLERGLLQRGARFLAQVR